MNALAREAAQRPDSAGDWFESFEAAVATQSEKPQGESRVVIMAPAGSEVYVDDERQGSVGRSGRVILTAIAPGQHVLRVARLGEDDDERVIGFAPTVQSKSLQPSLRARFEEHSQPARGGSLLLSNCGRLWSMRSWCLHSLPFAIAKGVKFCGSCGNTSFQSLTAALSAASLNRTTSAPEEAETIACPRCSQKYPSTTRFCGRCGIPIGTSSLDWRSPRPVEVLCKHCGASYPAAARFCGGCGKAFSP